MLCVRDKCVFCVLHRKFKMVPKSGEKTFLLQKVASRLGRYPAGQKFCQNLSILLRFRDKRFFICFTQIQDARQKWQENNFWEKSPVDPGDTLWVKNFIAIALSRSVSEINTFLCLTQKFKMAAKCGGKMLFCKKSPVISANTM